MRPVDLSVVIPSAREMRPSSRRWCAFAIALVGVHIVASLALRHSYGLTIFGDITQSVLIGFAMIATAINAAGTRDVTRTFWTLLTAGCILWLSAQLLWTWYEVVLRRDVPNPFIGDIVFFLHVVPFMAALAVRPQIQWDLRNATLGLIDLALLVSWWLYLYLLLVIPWQLVQVDLAIYGYSFDVVYFIENLFFVAAVAFVALRCDPPWRRFYWHLLGAAVIYTVGSQLAGMAINLGLYYTGSLYDIPLVISSAWFGCAALSARSLRPKVVPVDLVRSRVLLWPGRLAMTAVLSIPLVAWWVLVRGVMPPTVFHFRLLLTLAAVTLLTAIAFYKERLLNRELTVLAFQANAALQDLIRVQKQLVQSEKLASLGQMVAGAAHEFNNPLTAIIGYCDLMSDEGAEPATIAKKIGQQARRTKALVHNLLSFARESPADKRPTDFNAVVTSAIRLQQVQLVNSRVTLELDTDPSVPLVVADANQMLQVVLHVIGNAIDSLQSVGGGVLKLTTRTDGETVMCEVTDSGTGISQPDKVFDPFYTTKPVGKGTGLGLSMAYGIVSKHGGKISCWNNPDGGATFRIALPIGTATKAPQQAKLAHQFGNVETNVSE